MSKPDQEIEAKAVEIYERDGFALAICSAQESWSRDREDVRERYRKKARTVLEASDG